MPTKPVTRVVTRKVKSTHQIQSQSVSTIVNVNIDNTKKVKKKKRSPPRVVPPVNLNPAPPANRVNNDYTPNRPYIAEKVSIASPYNNGLIPDENLNEVDRTHRARTIESIKKEASVSGSLGDFLDFEEQKKIMQKMAQQKFLDDMEALDLQQPSTSKKAAKGKAKAQEKRWKS